MTGCGRTMQSFDRRRPASGHTHAACLPPARHASVDDAGPCELAARATDPSHPNAGAVAGSVLRRWG